MLLWGATLSSNCEHLQTVAGVLTWCPLCIRVHFAAVQWKQMCLTTVVLQSPNAALRDFRCPLVAEHTGIFLNLKANGVRFRNTIIVTWTGSSVSAPYSWRCRRSWACERGSFVVQYFKFLFLSALITRSLVLPHSWGRFISWFNYKDLIPLCVLFVTHWIDASVLD